MSTTQQVLITNYFHRGIPGPDGFCRGCGERLLTSVANQGQLVDISGYGYCDELSLLERLEIDLGHAQDRVTAIERQIARAKSQLISKLPLTTHNMPGATDYRESEG